MDPADREVLDAIRPVHKLFYPGAAAPSETSHELSKRAAPATFKTRVDENGFRWAEGFDASGELIYANIIFDESE